ncbi:MAG: ABC transporter ATP-binding protein [Clostridia bacterium]|nr:ABC transporter ATP-binding protein [Clostridia bacterium]
MKLILRYLKPFYARMILGLTIKVGASVMELILPYILAHIIDHVVPAVAPQRNVKPILLWGLVMIVCSLFAVIANITANRMAARVARDTSEQLRHDLFARVMHLSSRQIDRLTIPSLESRLTSDTYHVHHMIGMMQRMGVRAPILLIGGIAVAAAMEPVLTLVLVAVLPFITLTVWGISRKGIPLYTALQQKVDRLVRVVRENAQGIRVIKALSKTDYERRHFDEVNRDVVAAEKKAGITMAASNPLMNFFLNTGLTCVIVVGAFRVDHGLTEPGSIIAFMSFFTLISNAMLAVTRMFVMLSKGTASAGRIAEVIEMPADLNVESEADYPTRADGREGYITFEKVCFSYNKTKNNLTDISFRVPRGGTLGIIGATGSGKSTIIQLLMRFYDIDSGSIRIGGRDIRTIPHGELHQKFGVALQNDFLYAESLEENIAFGRDLSRAEIEFAARLAQAAPFIEDFDEGYLHMLTAKGTNISGGQKQRTLIARALAAKPEILILDDSSSALDYKTDANLRRAIADNLSGGTTTIVVAQRISSVMSADVILVIDEGRIIGMGDHDTLLASCDVYREISESQMGGAILE